MNIDHTQNFNSAINFGTISPRFKESLPNMRKCIQDSVSRCSDVIEKSKVVMLDVDMEKSPAPFLVVLKPLKKFFSDGTDLAKGAIITLCGGSDSKAVGSNIAATGIKIIQDGKETIHDITLNLGKGSSKATKEIVYKIFDFDHGFNWYDKVPVLGSLVDIADRVHLKKSYKPAIQSLHDACQFSSKEAHSVDGPVTIFYN